ncbi:hypothetical protein ACX0G9_05175 [Flavitalea flava]
MNHLRKYIFILFITLSGNKGFAQEMDKRLNFVVLIDNEVPTPSYILNGVFLIKDSTGKEVEKIPFHYQVGFLEMTTMGYNKFFNPGYKNNIYLKFQFYEMRPKDITHDYEYEIPNDMINHLYYILKVYNYSNKQSRKKYLLKKRIYGIELTTPGMVTVIPRKRKKFIFFL